MTQAGIAIHKDCSKTFEDMKMKKNIHFIIFQMNAAQTIVEITRIEEKKDGDDCRAKYKEFESEMERIEKEKNCAYAVFDFQYIKKNGSEINKIIFFSYCPDTSNSKLKMPYSATKGSLKKTLKEDAFGYEVQGNCADDISFAEVEKLIAQKYDKYD